MNVDYMSQYLAMVYVVGVYPTTIAVMKGQGLSCLLTVGLPSWKVIMKRVPGDSAEIPTTISWIT